MAILSSGQQPAWLQGILRLASGKDSSYSEQKYSGLDTGEEAGSPHRRSRGARAFLHLFHWSRRRTIFLALSGIILLSLSLVFSWAPEVDNPVKHRNSKVDRSRLHLLVPASKGDYQLCKLMAATAVLGYPSPQLINWGGEFHQSKPGELASGTHLAKISGVIQWLWTLEEHQMDDLVVIVDAYDLTLQLPPEVLINRYYQVNKENDLRMSQKPGMRRAMKERNFYQSVIFSADKRCSPQYHWQPWCYLQPESPLPADMYGNRTDKEGVPYGTDWVQPFRPRWLNSGMVMGPARDVLAIFLRAYQQMDKEKLGSDQSLFNLVFAEQEYMREFWRQQSVKWIDGTPGRIADWVKKRGLDKRAKDFNKMSQAEHIIDIVSPFNKDHKLMEPAFDRGKTEYHMGLDYYSRLSKTTVGSDHATRQFVYNTSPPTGNHTRDPRDCRSPEPLFATDLYALPAPFPRDLVVPEGQPAVGQTWADIPLFTEICSGAIPVSIHHNGNKMGREYQWPEMWYHRYLRPMLALKKAEALAAEATAAETGKPVVDVNDGRMWAGKVKVTFDDVCPTYIDFIYKGCMWGHGWDCKEGDVPQLGEIQSFG